MPSAVAAPRGASRSRAVSLAPLSLLILHALLMPRAYAVTPAPVADDGPQHRQPVDLDPVRVEGVRPVNTTEDIETARKRLDEKAGGTALVDGESYRDRRASTLSDALGYAPGVFVQSRFGAEEARISIRGSGLQRTFHGRGLVLLQDGTPLNLADGAVDFQAIEPLSARYISIHRGANALEYGAATLGGAVDFVSPTGFDAPALTLRGEAGAFDYRRGQVAVAGTHDRADGYASLTGMSQEGFREHAVQETYRFFGNAGLRFSDTLDGRLYATKVDSRSQLPGNLTFAEWRNDPTQAAPANVAMDQRRDFVLQRFAGKLAWTPDAHRQLVLSVFVSDKDLHHPIFQVLEQDSRDVGADLRWRGESTWNGHANVLVAGLRVANGTLHDDRFVNVGGQHGARTNTFDQHARDSVAYIEDQFAFDARWTLALGAQGLHSVRRSRDLFITGGRDESFDVTYSGVSPKVGLRYRIDDGAQVFANISRSLEPPSFGELTGGPGVTQVDKQRGVTAELGTRVQRATWWLDAAVYRARLDGELLALNDALGNPRGTVNADRTVHQGVELGGSRDWSDHWRLSVNYLFNDFRFDGDPVFGDNALAGVPRQQVRSEVRFSPVATFYVAANVDAFDRTWIDHANTLQAPGAAVWGLRVGGEAGARWHWFAEVRNVFDRRWVAGTNVVANAFGVDGRHVLPGDGRGVYAGFEMRR
ncbi:MULTISPECIES: TonB-dependent receptor family protein [Lysobacteraceae]|uniref:TonB-dependent receptor family protein n=1 Tax=Lysobacteraceae TaxID=32033 RepID=UPI001BCEFD0C|nr:MULTISPECIES: TonB-dependent receptor [Lysobacter]